MRIVVAITGASGAAYGVRFVERAAAAGATIDLIVSAAGARVAHEELDLELDPSKGNLRDRLGAHAALVTRIPLQDIGAECASGSVPFDGMAVVPCSMGTLARIAGGVAQNLIERAADVQLKERRPLVLVPREAPLNRIHLENLLRVHDAGAIVLPAMPAFYAGAATVADLVDTVVDRALAVFFGASAIHSKWVPPRQGGAP